MVKINLFIKVHECDASMKETCLDSIGCKLSILSQQVNCVFTREDFYIKLKILRDKIALHYMQFIAERTVALSQFVMKVQVVFFK